MTIEQFEEYLDALYDANELMEAVKGEMSVLVRTHIEVQTMKIENKLKITEKTEIQPINCRLRNTCRNSIVSCRHRRRTG